MRRPDGAEAAMRSGRPPGVPRSVDSADTARGPGHAAIEELRAALAVDDERRELHGGRARAGSIDRADRPVPLDEQVRAMGGDAAPGRLRRGPVERRRNPPGSQSAADPVIPLALSDFHDLRRLGLFGDDGRNPPPSWWAR